jgi:hypothetical protein
VKRIEMAEVGIRWWTLVFVVVNLQILLPESLLVYVVVITTTTTIIIIIIIKGYSPFMRRLYS